MTVYYSTGTVTVTAGSAVVTGAGTSFDTAMIDGRLWCQGRGVRILSRQSATQITLTQAWPGTTGSAQPYEIEYPSTVDEDTAALRANVTTLVGEVQAVFAEPWATADVSSFALTYLDDTSATAVLTTLGSGATGRTLFAAANAAAGRAALALGAAAERAVGVAAGTDVPDRAAADTRYALLSGASFTGVVDVTGNVGVTNQIMQGTLSATGATAGVRILTGVLDLSAVGTGAGTFSRFYNANGQIGSITRAASNIAFNTTSDERLKQDFRAFNGWDILSKIRVYDFQWRAGADRAVGVKAQELFDVFPLAVTPGEGEPGDEMDENGEGGFMPWSVDYSKIVPVLIQTIQELEARIAALEAKG